MPQTSILSNNFTVLQAVLNAEHGVSAQTLAAQLGLLVSAVQNILVQYVSGGFMRFDRRDSFLPGVQQRVYTLRNKRDELKTLLNNEIARCEQQSSPNVKLTVLGFIKNAPRRQTAFTISSGTNLSIEVVSSVILDLLEDGLIRRDRHDGAFFTEPSKREEIASMLAAPTPAVSAAPVQSGITADAKQVLQFIRENPHRVSMDDLGRQFGAASANGAVALLLSAGYIQEDTRHAGCYYTVPSKRDEILALFAPSTPAPQPTVTVPAPQPVQVTANSVLAFIKNAPHRVNQSDIAAGMGISVDGLAGVLMTLVNNNLIKQDSRHPGFFYTNPDNQAGVQAFLTPGAPTPVAAAPQIDGQAAVNVLRFIKEAAHRQNPQMISVGLGITQVQAEQLVGYLIGKDLIKEDSRHSGYYYTNPQNQAAVVEYLHPSTPEAVAPETTAVTYAYTGDLDLPVEAVLVLKAIKEAPHSLTVEEICSVTGFNEERVSDCIDELEGEDLIQEHRNGGKWFTNPDEQGAVEDVLSDLVSSTSSSTPTPVGYVQVEAGSGAPMIPVNGYIYAFILTQPHAQTVEEIANGLGLQECVVDEVLESLLDTNLIREHRDGEKYFTNEEYRNLATVLLDIK